MKWQGDGQLCAQLLSSNIGEEAASLCAVCYCLLEVTLSHQTTGDYYHQPLQQGLTQLVVTAK